jgi:sugar phosphate isomerase/epimerase
LPIAEEHDVTLAIKPVHVELSCDYAFLTSVAETLDLLRAYDHPKVRLAFDTYHMGWDADVPRRLAEIAPWVAIVHLGDGHPPTAGEVHRSRLGQGLVPLKEIVMALEQGGYSGYYDIKLVGMPVEPADYRDLLLHSRCRAAELLPAFSVGG